jgi:hypothetical protein
LNAIFERVDRLQNKIGPIALGNSWHLFPTKASTSGIAQPADYSHQFQQLQAKARTCRGIPACIGARQHSRCLRRNKNSLQKVYPLPAGLKSERRDLNPRPLAPQASALPGCATFRGLGRVEGFGGETPSCTLLSMNDDGCE